MAVKHCPGEDVVYNPRISAVSQSEGTAAVEESAVFTVITTGHSEYERFQIV